MMVVGFRRKVLRAGRTLAHREIVTGENLPWRRLRTPFRIFLAELLLIRTRTDVVSRIYEDVFNCYPDIFSLAMADENELRDLLRPLGLSKRIPYIIKAAQYICKTYDGQIPNDINALIDTPGLGTYSASAIVTFAYGKSSIFGDVNILRFIARLTGLDMEHSTKGSKQIREYSVMLLEENNGLSSEKLLDFTRLICRSRNPLCLDCPLIKQCYYVKMKQQ